MTEVEPTRLSLFNEAFLLILQQLVENIPHRKDFDPTILAARMGVDVTPERQRIAGGRTGGSEAAGFDKLENGDDFYRLYEATMDFMEMEGFIVRRGYIQGRSVTAGTDAGITAKGIAALNLPMPGRQRTVSDSIANIGKASAAEARQAVITEAIGIVMEAAARGFIGAGG